MVMRTAPPSSRQAAGPEAGTGPDIGNAHHLQLCAPPGSPHRQMGEGAYRDHPDVSLLVMYSEPLAHQVSFNGLLLVLKASICYFNCAASVVVAC